MRSVVHRGLLGRARDVPWQLRAGQLLEEHHLCATSDDSCRRERFVTDVGALLAQLDDSLVCTIDGERVRDLGGLCSELECGLDVGRIERSIDGPGGVVDALRRRSLAELCPAVKRRMIIWHEAHVLLREDPKLFGRAADAIIGVAAEHEFCSDDVLLIQRGVFVGRCSLDMYAEDPKGQFSSWYSEDGEPGLWRVVTGRESPGVARWKIGAELDDAPSWHRPTGR